VLLGPFLVAALAFGPDGAGSCCADVSVPSGWQEKEARTAAQRKINSQLLYEIYRRRGVADKKAIPPGPTDVRIDQAGRALVDVRAGVTPAIEKKIRVLGGIVISRSGRDQSIIARIPILNLERLAGDPRVRAIEPAAEAITNSPKR
jgi:hypothetical protein